MENHELLLAEHEFNLSDFALFLSVMKNPRAYQCALSIILAEPDIELVEVKVEQVVLNKVGKRAIRLDAWARSKDQRQFNMEMQNDSQSDDLRKRSRYYQSMIDTPILKSGKIHDTSISHQQLSFLLHRMTFSGKIWQNTRLKNVVKNIINI